MNTISEIFGTDTKSALNPDSHTSLYHQMYSLLKDAIVNGTLHDGMRLPTELELSDAFNVSRITTKRALDDLAAEGLVKRQRGRGTHVSYQYEPPATQHAPLTGMLQEIESMSKHTDARVLVCEEKRPPADIRAALGLGDNEKALHLLRVRYQGDRPFGYYDSWTVGMGSMDAAELKTVSRPDLFKKHGIRIDHMVQIISATGANEQVAAKLDVPVGHPLLRLQRQSYRKTGDGETMVDHLTIKYHPDFYQYRLDLTMDDQD